VTDAAPATAGIARAKAASKRRVLFASMIGTTIEYFDFYIYGTAAVLGIPEPVLRREQSNLGHSRIVRDLRAGILRAAGRFGAVRPFRRPRRAQGDSSSPRC